MPGFPTNRRLIAEDAIGEVVQSPSSRQECQHEGLGHRDALAPIMSYAKVTIAAPTLSI